jgi:hypothetical protein
MTTTEVKLPDSGVTIRVNRIAPATMMAIGRKFPDLKPPLQQVDYGNGSKRMEPNPLDPDYVLALVKHSQAKTMLVLETYARLGVDCDVDAQKVAEFRAYAEEMGLDIPKNDKAVYVLHILCLSNTDLLAMQNGVDGNSIPTEQAVTDKAATFPSNVQGNGHLEVEGAPVGGDVHE